MAQLTNFNNLEKCLAVFTANFPLRNYIVIIIARGIMPLYYTRGFYTKSDSMSAGISEIPLIAPQNL